MLIVRCLILNEFGQVLLIKRAADKSHYPGLWEFPGGKVEENEDWHTAIVREVEEETKLTPNIDTQNRQVVMHRSQEFRDIAPYMLCIADTATYPDVILKPEHSQFTWVTPQSVHTYELTPYMKDLLSAMTLLLARASA